MGSASAVGSSTVNHTAFPSPFVLFVQKSLLWRSVISPTPSLAIAFIHLLNRKNWFEHDGVALEHTKGYCHDNPWSQKASSTVGSDGRNVPGDRRHIYRCRYIFVAFSLISI